MNLLVVPDSFKGSLDSSALCDAITCGVRDVLPAARVKAVPMADGGEGTVEALVRASGGRVCQTRVRDPLGRDIIAAYGVLGGGRTAVIEMAQASGLPRLTGRLLDPFGASSFGTGQLIAAALGQGCGDIIMGLGGSATNDGGAGMLEALGARFYDEGGAPIAPGAAGLLTVARADLSGLDPRLDRTRFTVACDVQNPLCGPNGASAVYGPQKGARPEDIRTLDRALARFDALTGRVTGKSAADVPGAGAAGGMGAALMVYLGAALRPGFDIVAEVCGLPDALREGGFDLVVTGEGRMNAQSFMGKLPVEVARLAARYGVRTAAIVGGMTDDAREPAARVFARVYELMTPGMDTGYSMRHAARLVRESAARLARDWADGT